jgi:high-affinity iron transporter
VYGIEGKGDGPLSNSLTPHPADFTDSVWKHGESDGEIFMVITNGVENTAMPSFKDLKEEDRWNLVNYIKTFKSNVLLEHKTN